MARHAAIAIFGVAAALAGSESTARADAPLAVVVRSAGAPLVMARLRGQLADVAVTVHEERGALEADLDAQLVAAGELADADGARVVVWFVPRGKRGGLAVAIATPADHRLFVRELPAASATAVAEAAAVATRGALKAIAAGGTIGVEVPVVVEHGEHAEPVEEDRPAVHEIVPAPLPPVVDGARTSLEAAIGWQVALDGGADRGAQAIAQRTTIVHGAWGGSLGLALGIAGRRADGDVAVDLARSSGQLGVERRFGPLALGIAAGAVVYHRATVAAPVAATPATSTIAALAGLEVAWRWRPGGGHVGVVARLAVAAVAGAPALAIARGDGMVEALGTIHAVQGSIDLSVYAGLP